MALVASQESPEKWIVEFSRFFRFPSRRSSSATPPPMLRFLSKKKFNDGGTWMAASSQADLILDTSVDFFPVVTVSVSGVAYVNHLVYKLRFSWPQVSCVSNCPTRGSRAVFASFMDSSNQLQKFAMRFSSCEDAEAFLNSVKKCKGYIIPENESVLDNPYPSEHVSPNWPQDRIHDEPNFEDAITAYVPELPNLICYDPPSGSSSHPTQPDNEEHFTPGFSPCFEDVLNGYSAHTQIGTDDSSRASSNVISNDPSPSKELNLDLSSSGVSRFAEHPEPMNDEYVKSMILNYMTDASFNDILFKVEKVIQELGGELPL